jgi:hypothetical protein
MQPRQLLNALAQLVALNLHLRAHVHLRRPLELEERFDKIAIDEVRCFGLRPRRARKRGRTVWAVASVSA